MANFHHREKGNLYTRAPLRHPKACHMAGCKTKSEGKVSGEQWVTAGAIGGKRHKNHAKQTEPYKTCFEIIYVEIRHPVI